MRKTLRLLWQILTFPFRMLAKLALLPVEGFRRARLFLTEEPDDQPLTEAFTTTVKNPSALLEHVDALRKHLLRMVLVLVITVAISAAFTPQIIDFLSRSIGGIKDLQAIDVTESVGVFMRVALISGFALALPYIAFEIWLFAAPGLRPRARQMGLLGIPLALLFFLGGVAFAYLLLLPTALPFLLSFMGVHTIPRISSYVDFVTGLLFWIGIAFEFPLVIYVLSLMGIVKPRMLAKFWRYAIVIIAIVAAAVTPTVDPVNMSLVMAPMILLYFLSIGLSQLAVLGQEKDPMSKSPVTLVLLIVTWTVFLVAGVGLIWQALLDKSSPARSRTRRVVNEIKFRFGFASGVVLILLFLSGVIWMLAKW